MARLAPADREWMWYAIWTGRCVPLDRYAYPSTLYDGRRIPWPDWACRAPGHGVHKNDRVGRIDVHVAEPPNKRDEISWTWNFSVFILSKTWVKIIEGIIDPDRVFLDLYF